MLYLVLGKLDNLINFVRKFPILKKFPVNFYRFVFVGLSVFVVDFVIFNTLFHLLGFQVRIDIAKIGETTITLSVPNIISVLISTVYGYILNKNWSFENKSDNVASQFSKYLGVAIFNNTINNLLFGFLYYNIFGVMAGLAPIIATTISKICATSFQVVSSFLLYKFVVFREDKEVISEALVP